MKFAKELEQELVPGKWYPASPPPRLAGARKVGFCEAYLVGLPPPVKNIN